MTQHIRLRQRHLYPEYFEMKITTPTFIACLAVATLSGCSILSGKPYIQPSLQESYAEVTSNDGLLIHTFNDKGCFAGKTSIDNQTIRVYPDKEAVFNFEQYYGDYFCRVPFSFVPVANKKYIITSSATRKASTGLGLGSLAPNCRVSVVEVDAEGNKQPVTITPMRLKTGFACIRFVPLSDD